MLHVSLLTVTRTGLSLDSEMRPGELTTLQGAADGGLAERFIALVLKTSRAIRVLAGSNPAPSANIYPFRDVPVRVHLLIGPISGQDLNRYIQKRRIRPLHSI